MIRKTLLLTAILFITGNVFAQKKDKKMNDTYSIAIHGGAGTILKEYMSEEKEKAYREKLEQALKAGEKVLKEGGSAVDAVQAAINIMEDSPLFNAGKGAVFTNDEENEMDASIMRGEDLQAGAVAGVHTVKNPINAARKVMEESPHVMLSGAGADKFSDEQGLEIMDPSYFKVEKRLEQLRRIKEKNEDEIKLDHSDDEGSINPLDVEFGDKKHGTVGCVALDMNGNLAAGTSTGGMTNKKYDRIGDSPIIAAGTYANNKTCAVSSTGHGEFFIRAVVAYDISALMEYKGWSLEKSADHVINKKLRDMEGAGGVIAVDNKGNVSMPFNTTGMYRGSVSSQKKMEIRIFKSE